MSTVKVYGALLLSAMVIAGCRGDLEAELRACQELQRRYGDDLFSKHPECKNVFVRAELPQRNAERIAECAKVGGELIGLSATDMGQEETYYQPALCRRSRGEKVQYMPLPANAESKWQFCATFECAGLAETPQPRIEGCGDDCYDPCQDCEELYGCTTTIPPWCP